MTIDLSTTSLIPMPRYRLEKGDVFVCPGFESPLTVTGCHWKQGSGPVHTTVTLAFSNGEEDQIDCDLLNPPLVVVLRPRGVQARSQSA